MVYFHRTLSLLLISFALVLTSSLPSSLSQDDSDSENSLRALCTDNFRPEQCWNIIKNNYDRFKADNISAAKTAVDLARGKGVEILNLLNQLHNDSGNQELKEKYQSCASNYNNSINDIDYGKSILDPGNLGRCEQLSTQIYIAIDDFKECRHSFEEGSFDPAHILDRNHEFFVYAQIAHAATERVDDVTWSCD